MTEPRIDGGLLVAFEGIDGAGKTTQAALLEQTLRTHGFVVLRTKEPTDGPFGRRIKESSRDGRLPPREELELFLSDRRQHVETRIAPALAAGAIVIVDRYYHSTAAYQGARGLDPVEILAANERFAPLPHVLVYLRLAPEHALDRIRERGLGTNLFEREDDLRRTASIFERVTVPVALCIDGLLSPAEIHDRIVEFLRSGPLAGRLA